MEAQFLIAGFGGQGVLLIGQLLAKAAMHEGMNVSWMPSYGPEMRGGEANCAVVISDEPIGSPLVTEIPIAVIMNKPSMIKFTPAMEKGGIMLGLFMMTAIGISVTSGEPMGSSEITTAQLASPPRISGP